jgi:hypothetical protein
MKREAKSDIATRIRTKADPSRWIPPALCFAYLVSGALIIAAARGDLWLDEIWSLSLARTAKTSIDVLTHFHHDNNHILNTLFLKLAGDQQSLFIYRLFAVFSGIGALFVVGLLARNWGSLEALISVLLTGTSYPLLLYFSEARGYAPAILFGLLSYLLLRQNRDDFRLYRIPLFWTVSILGVVSHLTFLIVSTALLVLSLVHESRVDESLKRRASRVLLHHLPPFVFLVWLYMIFVRDMVTGGGPIDTKWNVIAQASGLVLGFPQEPAFQAIAVICVAGLLAMGTYTLRRNGDEEWLFYPTVLFFTPMLMLILTRSKYLYFRYLLVSFPFFYLLLSYLLGSWCRSGLKSKRWLVVMVVALIVVGQTHKSYQLLIFGRGSYSAALVHIAENSPEGAVRIGGDHDFRNRIIVEFYAPRLSITQRLRYVAQSDWYRETPDWLVTHSQDTSYQHPPEITVLDVGVYRFIDAYRFGGISGWNWYLYRRETVHR